MNAKESEEYFKESGNHYSSLRIDEHCAICSCNLKLKTRCMSCKCPRDFWGKELTQKQEKEINKYLNKQDNETNKI